MIFLFLFHLFQLSAVYYSFTHEVNNKTTAITTTAVTTATTTTTFVTIITNCNKIIHTHLKRLLMAQLLTTNETRSSTVLVAFLLIDGDVCDDDLVATHQLTVS